MWLPPLLTLTPLQAPAGSSSPIHCVSPVLRCPGVRGTYKGAQPEIVDSGSSKVQVLTDPIDTIFDQWVVRLPMRLTFAPGAFGELAFLRMLSSLYRLPLSYITTSPPYVASEARRLGLDADGAAPHRRTDTTSVAHSVVVTIRPPGLAFSASDGGVSTEAVPDACTQLVMEAVSTACGDAVRVEINGVQVNPPPPLNSATTT